MKSTTWLEYIAVFSRIISVWFSRKENIWVYPTGLINSTFYIYLSFKGSLFGEASVNLYYTIMSIYGWMLWAKKDHQQEHIVIIKWSSKREWTEELIFFSSFYIAIFIALTFLKRDFASGAIPWADAFASATAFTGMWLMARKKSRKLVLVDRNKYCFYTFIFCEALCIYKCLLSDSFDNGCFGINRMEQKGK